MPSLQALLLPGVIDRYLARNVLIATALGLLVLATLALFFAFTGMAGDIGQGSFGVPEALLAAVYSLPSAVFQLFPMAALLGSLLGLGALADTSELTAIRAAGMSVARVARAVVVVGIGLSLVAMMLGEWLVPSSQRATQRLKALTSSDSVSVQGRQGVWLRDGPSFINAQRVLAPGQVHGVTIFTIDQEGRLVRQLEADSAQFEHQQWVLNEVRELTFGASKIEQQHRAQLVWPGSFDPNLLDVVAVEPQHMGSAELREVIAYQKANGLESARFELAFWNKLIQPLATAVMVVLGIPFVFGSQRGGGAGKRITVGVLIAIGFYALNTTVSRMGLLYGVPPLLSALVPTLAFFLIGIVGLKRVK